MTEVLLRNVFYKVPENKRAQVKAILEDKKIPAILRADTVQKMHLNWWKQGLCDQFETEDQLTNWYMWQYENLLHAYRNITADEWIEDNKK